MKRSKASFIILWIFIVSSLTVKIILIFKYNNQLTLSSDDLNYIKSAVVLLKKGVFIFHNFDEPTVFVTPLYPFFLAGIFKLFGHGILGLQAVRIIQAVLSCATIGVIFMIAKNLFDARAALVSSFLMSFYLPNIITVGYLLTETLFTMLLCIFIYFSIKFFHSPGYGRFAFLGFLWAVTTLCRPTIALYPLVFFLCILLRSDLKVLETLKLGLVMFFTFTILMLPWWIRNYLEYAEFIPLAASTGNPMLQGTYVNYRQTPENIVYYKLGENAYETDKNEVKLAVKRIKSEFKKNFWSYLRWFTLGKTCLFWGTIFYWKEFFGISRYYVYPFHYILLFGFAGMALLLFKDFYRYVLPVSVILYFNIIHCVYMAFDRYAFPLMHLLSVFCAYFLLKAYDSIAHKGSI